MEKKVYVVDTDAAVDGNSVLTMVNQKPMYSPTTGRMEAGGVFDFANAVVYDPEDSTTVIFEPKVKPVDFDSIFGRTPVLKVLPPVSIKKVAPAPATAAATATAAAARSTATAGATHPGGSPSPSPGAPPTASPSVSVLSFQGGVRSGAVAPYVSGKSRTLQQIEAMLRIDAEEGEGEGEGDDELKSPEPSPTRFGAGAGAGGGAGADNIFAITPKAKGGARAFGQPGAAASAGARAGSSSGGGNLTSLADIANFKTKLDKLVAEKKQTYGLYATSMVKRLNTALLLIKPHASKVAMQYLVSSILDTHEIRVLSRGKITGKEAAAQQLCDRQFAKINKYAVTDAVALIVLDGEESQLFQSTFDVSWRKMVEKKRVLNAVDACNALGVDEIALYKLWARTPQEHCVKLRYGLQVCMIQADPVLDSEELQQKLKKPVYVLNGFYPSMRSTYISPGATIHYMVVEWEGNKLSWPELLRRVVGVGDPARADPQSIRGKLFLQWEELGLQSPPDRRDNGVHFSKSAFEGLVDRLVWSKGAMLFTDTFGSRLLSNNVPAFTVQNWLNNPVVQNRHIFEHMYALEAEECLLKAQTLLCAFVKNLFDCSLNYLPLQFYQIINIVFLIYSAL
jgi:hypothetical protein